MYANDASVPRDKPHRAYSPTLSETEITEGFRKDLLLIIVGLIKSGLVSSCDCLQI